MGLNINTLILKTDENNIKSTIIKAGELLKNGSTVVFPTETVYGIGANIYSDSAVKGIFAAKGRPSDNPLIVHVAEKEDIFDLASDVTPVAKKLINSFMPGAITVIVKKSVKISDAVTAGLDTVAIRMPKSDIARAVIREAGVPIAAPSANISGFVSPTSYFHVINDLDGRVGAIICGDDAEIGIESTVVLATGDTPVILRPGFITKEDIEKVCGECLLGDGVEKSDPPLSPGMKYRHYSPNASMVVVKGRDDAVWRKINEIIKMNTSQKVGVIMYDRMKKIDCDMMLFIKNDEDFAKHLFSHLRRFDEGNMDMIISVSPSEEGLGAAVRNRLFKAAGNNVIEV